MEGAAEAVADGTPKTIEQSIEQSIKNINNPNILNILDIRSVLEEITRYIDDDDDTKLNKVKSFIQQLNIKINLPKGGQNNIVVKVSSLGNIPTSSSDDSGSNDVVGVGGGSNSNINGGSDMNGGMNGGSTEIQDLTTAMNLLKTQLELSDSSTLRYL